MNWTHAGTAFMAAFLASLVECVEAMTIVLAVGTTRGWRSAAFGAIGGASVLALLVLMLGPALTRIPLANIQIVIGALLVLFGTRWLRKAVLRASGALALRDEDAVYANEIALMESQPRDEANRVDGIAIATTLKAVVLEGIEVVFIIMATGAGGKLLPASIGAAVAAAAVIGLGFVLREPLTRVPENSLKFAVGVLLSAFGIFWIGEGLGFQWPGGDFALLGLAVGILVIAAVAVRTIRSRA
jgi:uncharacterized membrane protein